MLDGVEKLSAKEAETALVGVENIYSEHVFPTGGQHILEPILAAGARALSLYNLSHILLLEACNYSLFKNCIISFLFNLMGEYFIMGILIILFDKNSTSVSFNFISSILTDSTLGSSTSTSSCFCAFAFVNWL